MKKFIMIRIKLNETESMIAKNSRNREWGDDVWGNEEDASQVVYWSKNKDEKSKSDENIIKLS
jgi:hypothetical protein